MEAGFSVSVQTGSEGRPASYTMGVKRPGRGVDHPILSSAEVKERVELYGPFPGVKRPRCGVDHTPLSTAEVKERVELYLYSLLGLRGFFLGEFFFFFFYTHKDADVEGVIGVWKRTPRKVYRTAYKVERT